MTGKPYPRWFYRLPARYYEAAAPNNPYPQWFTWLGLIAIILLELNSFYEWFAIRVLADSAMITDYKSVYASPETYALSALRFAVYCLPLTFLFFLAVKKKTTFHRLLAFGSLILAFAFCLFIN